MAFREPIRLIIWDLDETLWRGTLEEGEITVPSAHVEIIETLARRGIVSSVCSKNDYETAKSRLVQHGLWDRLVFPRIAYSFKSDMVANIIEQIGLRPQTVLFIDDNPFNRGEVEERVPGINVVDEGVIPFLLEHPQLVGKPDEALTRLARYRVLETKQAKLSTASDPIEFLRSCEIVCSFHFDVEAQFERIHELVNRTNQLNFTKARWPEHIEAARAAYVERATKQYGTHAGYVKVRDRFGYYGICGFFELSHRGRALAQFLFSCRVLSMGVEQFVYQRLGFPFLKADKSVVVKLSKSVTVDWIKPVPDADVGTPSTRADKESTLCLHGPCELTQSVHYLRPHFAVIEEFQYPKEGWAIVRPLLRYAVLEDELKERGIETIEQLGLPAWFSGIDLSAIGSAIFSGNSDACCWSFSAEISAGMYRHKQSGLLFPLVTTAAGLNRGDLSKFAFSAFVDRGGKIPEDQFALLDRFEFVGVAPTEQLISDLRVFRAKITRSGRPFIIIESFDDDERIERACYTDQRRINGLVREQLTELRYVSFIRFADCVTDTSEEISANHFARTAYMRLADRIRETLSSELKIEANA